MDLSLTGRVAIVTGAAKGIGLAVVRALVEEGAHVIAGSRTISSDLKELSSAGSITAVEVDLTDADAARQLTAAAGSRIDILVNNVGGAPARPDGFMSVEDDQWRATYDLNVLVAVRMTRNVLPAMIAAGSGSIVNICSVNARLPDPGVIDYCAAKAALASFSKSLSKEVGPKGIRVNAVSPGPVATDLWLGEGGVAQTFASASGAQPADVVDQASKQMVTGRFTTPREVADVVSFLASDRTSNVTGSEFTIDGGLVTTV